MFFRNDGTARWPVWTFVSRSVLPELNPGDRLIRTAAAMCDIDGDDDLFAVSSEGKVFFYKSRSEGFHLVTDSFVPNPYGDTHFS